MPDTTTFSLFLAAAILLAITPGPGIFYVLTRSLKGGRHEGYASAFGTAIGGMVHVVAAALGLSAILATSAVAFFIVKYAGAAYLIYLGVRTIMSKDEVPELDAEVEPNNQKALYQGIVTEVLNPKTAIFFLAFIPQFVNLEAAIVPQFILLGSISVFLNTSADVIVATLAGPIGQQLKKRATLRKGQRLFTGFSLVGLGLYVALTGSEHKA